MAAPTTPAAVQSPVSTGAPGQGEEEPVEDELVEEELLVEEISIDGMCGVY